MKDENLIKTWYELKQTSKEQAEAFAKIYNLDKNDMRKYEKDFKKYSGEVKNVKPLSRKVAGIIAGLSFIAGMTTFTALGAANNDQDKTKDDENQNKTNTEQSANTEDKSKVKSNLDIYDESTKSELDAAVEEYWNTLHDDVKAKFNNDITYLKHFGYWINGIEIKDFNENYIIEIYEMITNANDLIALKLENGLEWNNNYQYIDATPFIPETSQYRELFEERENYRDTIVEAGKLNDEKAISVSKKWMKSDIKRFYGYELDPNKNHFQDLPSQYKELYYNTFSEQGCPHLNVLEKNLGKDFAITLTEPTINEKVDYKLVLEPDTDKDAEEIHDGGSMQNYDYERYYTTDILASITRCDNNQDNQEELIADDPNTYGVLLEIQEQHQKEKTDTETSKKLEYIKNTKENLQKMKELYVATNGNDKILIRA